MSRPATRGVAGLRLFLEGLAGYASSVEPPLIPGLGGGLYYQFSL